MNNASLLARKNAATPRGVGVMCEFYAARAENAEIWDIEGKRYIDLAAVLSWSTPAIAIRSKLPPSPSS